MNKSIITYFSSTLKSSLTKYLILKIVNNLLDFNFIYLSHVLFDARLAVMYLLTHTSISAPGP